MDEGTTQFDRRGATAFRVAQAEKELDAMPALHVVTETLIAAAVEFDALAARLEASVALNSAAIRVLPAGGEEVSLHAARYFGALADTFTTAVTQGIVELRETANTLRAQAALYAAEDLALGASLSAGR